jgi:hypothetical protein
VVAFGPLVRSTLIASPIGMMLAASRFQATAVANARKRGATADASYHFGPRRSGMRHEHPAFACEFHEGNDMPLWEARGQLGWAERSPRVATLTARVATLRVPSSSRASTATAPSSPARRPW